jgi:hypothetical protein
MWAVSFIDGELGECKWKPHQQRIFVLAELQDLRDEYERMTGWECVTPEEYLADIETTALFVFVNDKVVCLSETRPGFSRETVIAEEFVGRGVDVRTVAAIARAAGAMVGLKRFVVGTRAPANGRIAGLAKLYQREGLAISTIELMGEVNGQQENP